MRTGVYLGMPERSKHWTREVFTLSNLRITNAIESTKIPAGASVDRSCEDCIDAYGRERLGKPCRELCICSNALRISSLVARAVLGSVRIKSFRRSPARRHRIGRQKVYRQEDKSWREHRQPQKGGRVSEGRELQEEACDQKHHEYQLR